jgi:hypothetical protein
MQAITKAEMLIYKVESPIARQAAFQVKISHHRQKQHFSKNQIYWGCQRLDFGYEYINDTPFKDSLNRGVQPLG